MGSEDLLVVLKGIPDTKIAYEVIVQSLIEPLYSSKKLKTNIYTKIKREVDVLRSKRKKNKDLKIPKNESSPSPTSRTPKPESSRSTVDRHSQQRDHFPIRPQGRYPSFPQHQYSSRHRAQYSSPRGDQYSSPNQSQYSSPQRDQYSSQGQGRHSSPTLDQYPSHYRDRNSTHKRDQYADDFANKVSSPPGERFPRTGEQQYHTARASSELYDKHSEKHFEENIYKLEEMKETNRQLEKDIENLQEALENARDNANDLRTRLSKIAGDQLKTNNPNISDLSDVYRPTNLGQQYSELYDNEWSDAYEEVQRTIQDETKSINLLHDTVKHAFSSCERKAKLQEEKIKDILLDNEEDLESDEGGNEPKGMDNLHNALIDIRKKILPISSMNVAKNYWTQEFSQMSSAFDIKKPGQKLRAFALKCAQLCWCMNMCDPPMGMSHDQKGQAFDKHSFREYTKSVKNLKQPVVEFFVWPALYLNVGGHMVSKGVAQPLESAARR